MHICWGNYEGPHTHDMPLTDVLPLLFKAKPKGLLIEGANPRHEHEWEDWKTHKLPDDKVLIAGVIDTSTNFVEHPEAGRAAHRPLCERDRPRARHRRHRLRPRHVRRLRPGAPGHRLGQAADAGRRRGDRVEQLFGAATRSDW